MRILALEPYFGGSHAAFLDGWRARSVHDWTVLTDRPCHWKWRMRHAAVTMADETSARVAGGEAWDVLWASSMLNLAEFRGLLRGPAASLPAVLYFHENQAEYPSRRADERDVHFALSQFVSALAADEVWFNSAYGLESFFGGLGEILASMPRPDLRDRLAGLRPRCRVEPPGVCVSAARGPRAPGPMRILWAARWEHDKGPATFFAALDRLVADGTAFEVSVVGEQFRDVPPVFAEARARLGGRVRRWGYQPTRAVYEQALVEADVFVSTAEHEFFGIAAVEAAVAGAFPVLPARLAYPEVFGLAADGRRGEWFYDGSAEGLARRLGELARRLGETGCLWGEARPDLGRYDWQVRAREMDEGVERVGG